MLVYIDMSSHLVCLALIDTWSFFGSFFVSYGERFYTSILHEVKNNFIYPLACRWGDNEKLLAMN